MLSPLDATLMKNRGRGVPGKAEADRKSLVLRTKNLELTT
jgi:hypothetical protein